MFEDYSQYSKEKVNLFLRYLAYAAFRQVKKENRQQIVGNEEVKTVFTKKELLEQGNFKQRIEDRLMKLNVDRRTELEDKISIHYTIYITIQTCFYNVFTNHNKRNININVIV